MASGLFVAVRKVTLHCMNAVVEPYFTVPIASIPTLLFSSVVVRKSTLLGYFDISEVYSVPASSNELSTEFIIFLMVIHLLDGYAVRSIAKLSDF